MGRKRGRGRETMKNKRMLSKLSALLLILVLTCSAAVLAESSAVLAKALPFLRKAPLCLPKAPLFLPKAPMLLPAVQPASPPRLHHRHCRHATAARAEANSPGQSCQ